MCVDTNQSNKHVKIVLFIVWRERERERVAWKKDYNILRIRQIIILF